MKKLLIALFLFSVPAFAQRPTPTVIGGSTSAGVPATILVDGSGIIAITTLGGMGAQHQQPLPTVVGGATTAGIVETLLTDADGTVHVSCSDCSGGATTIAATQVAVGTGTGVAGSSGFTFASSGILSTKSSGAHSIEIGDGNPITSGVWNGYSVIDMGGVNRGDYLIAVDPLESLSNGAIVFWNGATNGFIFEGNASALNYDGSSLSSSGNKLGTSGSPWGELHAGGGAMTYTGGTTGALSLSGTGAHTLEIGKISASATAPGAGFGSLHIRAGTNAGSCKLTINAGTSATETTIIDNIGSGC